MAAFEAARDLSLKHLKGSTLYTTLSPCPMCAGAAIFFKVKTVVIAENTNMSGSEDLLRNNGIEVIVLNDEDCADRMRDFIHGKPEQWYVVGLSCFMFFTTDRLREEGDR